jgi:hypothetical protein
MLDQGIPLGKVVLDDEVLFVGEGEVNRLDLFEMRGLLEGRLDRLDVAVHGGDCRINMPSNLLPNRFAELFLVEVISYH